MTKNVYIPVSEEGYEFCYPVLEEDFETLHQLIDGTPRTQSWSPIQMGLIRQDEGQGLDESDSPFLGSHALVFRKAAAAQLQPLLDEYGELLPVHCEDADLSIFNPLMVIDALDQQASSIVRISSGRIIRVSRYVFRPDVVGDIEIFKIPEFRVSPTFVGQLFVDRWLESGLAGLAFEKVWSGAPSR